MSSLLINNLVHQTRHLATTNPLPNKVALYLQRAKLIDSIRLGLLSNSQGSLIPIVNDPGVDSFVVTSALRSAPSPESALSLIETLKTVPHFSHSQTTLHALAKILARTGQTAKLNALIDAINAGKFRNVARVSFMDRLRWYAAAGDLDSLLLVWDEMRHLEKRPRTETYNIVMGLYVEKGKDAEPVELFYRLIDEGGIPNSRTYTVMIKHLAMRGKLKSALEIFNTLPLMRVKRTLQQFSILVRGFAALEQFDVVKILIREMRNDGTMPGRAMRLSLQSMQEAGFAQEVEEYLREMRPDERIEKIEFCMDGSDSGDDEDANLTETACDANLDRVQLKPWLGHSALASALSNWGPDEISSLEEANFVWTSRLVCKVIRNFKSPRTAWEFFCWVAYQPGFTHDIYTVQRTIAILARHGNVELVDKLLEKVRKEGFVLPFTTIRLIIDFYGLSKNADAALKIFSDYEKLCNPISDSNLLLLYSSLLRTLTKCNRSSDTFGILDRMILCGIYPDIQTFSGLMHYFALQGDIKAVQKLFVMIKQTGVGPDAYMFKVLIEAYCKLGSTSLAWRAFEDMRNAGLIPDATTKALLVKSLWKEGKRREVAAVEDKCEQINDVLPLALRGHVWSVNSADLARVYSIYRNNFMGNCG